MKINVIGSSGTATMPRTVARASEICAGLADGDGLTTAELSARLGVTAHALHAHARHKALVKFRLPNYHIGPSVRGTIWANEATVRRYYADQDHAPTE